MALVGGKIQIRTIYHLLFWASHFLIFCTQSALKPHNKSPETRINAGFPSSIFLFKLYVVIYILYSLDFIFQIFSMHFPYIP